MISYPMTPQYVKAGPASKLASQIRHVTLNPSVLESINSFLHALLSAIVCEIATSQANSRKEDLLHPHTSSPGCRAAEESRIQERIKYPVTTDSFKKASLSICGKNNILVREAILEAEVIQNEWIRAKGKELDPALIVGETEEEVGKKDFLDVPSPFNRRKYSRSTSTLQSISDAGEDEDEEQIDGPRIGPRAAASPERLPHSALTHSSPAPKFIGVQEYMIEVQKALEHLSPLSSNTNLFNTFESRSRAASSQSPLYTTPLLVLYMSAFLHVIASEIIEGTGDIVVMKTTASEATMEDMKELMMGDDHLRFLWCKLQLSSSSVESHKARPKSAITTRPRSQSDIPVPLSRSVSTTPSINPIKQVKRLSIDSELAQAHRDIITLSRASPIERAEAELIRRKSWSEAVCESEKAEAEEGLAREEKEDQEEENGEHEKSRVRYTRKIDGLRPTIAHEESEEEERMSSRRAMKQSDLLQRPASSLAITSSRLGMMLRRSVSTQRKHDVDYGKPAVYAGVADKQDVETAEERSKKAGGGSNMQRSSIPMKASATGRRSTSRRSLSMSTGRNVVHKGARQLTASESGYEGSGAVMYLDANEYRDKDKSVASPIRLSPSTAVNGTLLARRSSEDPEFEDLIMRGDTLRMTLTPSRFRQPSKDGTLSETPPRKAHGTSSSQHARKHSSSRSRGYSNTSRDSPSSSSTSLAAIPPTFPPASSAIKLKARPATASRRGLLRDDDTDTSNTEREDLGTNQDDEEELDLNSEDGDILGPSSHHRRAAAAAMKRKKGKESLFDILNSSPPWENDHAEPAQVGRNGSGGASKAERMMGLGAGSQMGNKNALQAPPHIRPKKFAPIANLDMIISLDPPAPVREIGSNNSDSYSILSRATEMTETNGHLNATPSMADTRSLLTTTSLDAGSDFFSSKASFALTRKEFPLPPQGQGQQATEAPPVRPAHSSFTPSSNALSSYKSTPNLNAAAAASVANQMRPVRKRMEAKDERQVNKGVSDDLIAFLRDAPPPPPTMSAMLPPAPSQASLPLLTSTGNAKTRLGSVNFRSFMRGGSKRPSTAPGINTLDGFPISVASNDKNLPFADEMGRMRTGGQNGRSVHGSLLNIGRRQSESQDATSESPYSRAVGKEASGSVPPVAFLAHSAHRQHSQLPPTPRGNSTTTLIMTAGHAASPAARQARTDWELAQMMEKELEREETIARLRQPLSSVMNQVPHSYGSENRDVVTHPSTKILQAPMLTPEHSRDDLYHTSKRNSMASSPTQPLQAEAISGVDTPPTTPDEKTYAPQFRPLQSLPEEGEAIRPRTSSGSLSASPSTVMPGMAHKHQRRLSAVRRKPSPRVDQADDNSVSVERMKNALQHGTASSVTLYDAPEQSRSRQASSSSASSGLDPAFATPATKMVNEYRGYGKKAVILSEEADASPLKTGQASIRSIPNTITSISSMPLSELASAQPVNTPRTVQLTRSASTTITSRPPSTVLMPLSPRYGMTGPNGAKHQADVHDILLSLRNNMISATSVMECLEMIDAALFEVAYDTQNSYAPSVIEEEPALLKANDSADFSAQREKIDTQEGSPKKQDEDESALTVEEVDQERISEIPKLRPRTSRYINRAYDALVEYLLLHPSPPSIFPKDYHRRPATKTYDDSEQIKKEKLVVEDVSLDTIERVPSLGYSATSTESDDGSTVIDKTVSDITLVSDKEGIPVKQVQHLKEVSLAESEEDEQEILQRLAEMA